MQHYRNTINKRINRNGNATTKNTNHILKNYPEMLLSLNCGGVSSALHDSSSKRRRRRRRGGPRRDLPRKSSTNNNKGYRKTLSVRQKQFECALFDAIHNEDANKTMRLFNCPVCRRLLKGPVTVPCGHTFCGECLSVVNDRRTSCAVCLADIDMHAPRCVNVLVQEIVEKWRERYRSINGLEEDYYSIPNTSDILGIEPRYHLRSGYIGLQVIGDNNVDIDLNDVNDTAAVHFKQGKSIESNNVVVVSHKKMSNKRFSHTLSNVFREVDDIKEKALKSSWQQTNINDLECILCSRCILDPVTTACGHTFCRYCLIRVLDHGLSCPLCMAPLSVSDYSRGSTIVLDQAIKFLVREEYSERLFVHIKENQINRNAELPVFVCTNAFPGVACPLSVYEPRYRLLVRRCLMSSTRRFAMAAKASAGEKFAAFGTVLEVKDALYLQDGRFILTTSGIRRFKVTSRGEQDGYDTARIQYIKDIAITAEKLPELMLLHEKVHSKASKWILSLTPKVLGEVERLIGNMPSVEKNWISLPDGPSWTWWLIPVLPLSSQLQIGFLRTVSLEKRLRAIDKMLDHIKIRMKALERNTLNYALAENAADSCSDSERTFEMNFTDNNN